MYIMRGADRTSGATWGSISCSLGLDFNQQPSGHELTCSTRSATAAL